MFVCNFKIKYPLNCHYGDPLSVSLECLTNEISTKKKPQHKNVNRNCKRKKILFAVYKKQRNKQKKNVSVKMHGE